MSSVAHPSATRSPSSAANGGGSSSSARPTNIVPTNNVTTAGGITVRTRIEGSLTVNDVVRQLCAALQIKGPWSSFSLRDEANDELVTNENLRQKIENKSNLKLVSNSQSAHAYQRPKASAIPVVFRAPDQTRGLVKNEYF